MKYHKLLALAAAASAATALACNQAPTPPTSPAGTQPGAIAAGPDGATLKASAPGTFSPVGGIEITDLDPDLVVTNATPTYVPDLPLSYVFEVFGDKGELAYQSNPIPAGANGRTTHELTKDLRMNEVHTWRAYAVYQGQRGPMSGVASFKTFDRFGVSCAHLPTELDIVNCRRAQFGFLSHDDRPEYVKRIAYDLNRGGFEHRPYGILVKDTGNNCNGYSCDIVCSGEGGGQRQWDVLEDEDLKQAPVWNRVPEISARPCEFMEGDR
ncbi:MAG: hypothetical protein WD227_17355 [Vicinamibacterales bacterium]